MSTLGMSHRFRKVARAVECTTTAESRAQGVPIPEGGGRRERERHWQPSDVRRVKAYLGEKARTSGISLREVLHTWLFTDPSNIEEMLRVILLGGKLLDEAVMRTRLYASLNRVCIASSISQARWDCAILAAEQAFKKGVHGTDGPAMYQATKDTLRLGIVPSGTGQLARLMRRGADVYPAPQDVSNCAVGRLGARVPDGSVPSRLVANPMPELRVVAQRPLECRWSVDRFWTLMEATASAFPCVLQQHPSVITTEGLAALCIAGGRAIILRSKYVQLIAEGEGVEAWSRNLKLRSLNTLTAASASVCLILRAKYEWSHKVCGFRFRTATGCSAVVVSDHQYLSFAGYPLMHSHPARMVGSPLEVAQSRSLAGTGGDRDAVFEYVKEHFTLLRDAGWSLEEAFMFVGDFCSGGSYMGAVLWEVADHFGMIFSFRFCIEGAAKALSGHQFGWCGQRPLLVLTDVVTAPVEELQRACPPGGSVICGTVCNPLSSAATSKSGKEKRSEVKGAYELAATCIEKAVALHPNFIFFENVDNLRTDASLAQVWSDLQAFCMKWDHTYEWTWQSVCPAVLLLKPMARLRLFASARRRVPISTSSAAASVTRPAGSAGKMPAPTTGAPTPKRFRVETGVAELPADTSRSGCWATGGPTASRNSTDTCSLPIGGGPSGPEVTLSTRLLVGAQADAADAGRIVGAPAVPGHQLRTMRGSTSSRRFSLRGSATIGDFTISGREWRSAPITLASGESGTVVQRRVGGRWVQFCLIAPSLHLLAQGISGGGYFSLLPETSRRSYLASFVGEELSDHDSAAEAVVEAKKRAEGLAESCIMVVLRGGRWTVLDAAEAGPPYLQLINDPSPHIGANAVVSDAGEVFLDGTVDSYNLEVEHELQAGAEVLWLYGKHYELVGQP